MTLEVSFPHKKIVRFAGVLNVTPDSFSDGAADESFEALATRARSLARDGADYIDVGGDSTRPGSLCVGEAAEWSRIKSIVHALSSEFTLSVDTHHPSVARNALASGVTMINDISGGSEEMFRAVNERGATIIVMYSRCSKPHQFDLPRPVELFSSIERFFVERLELANRCGLKREQILLDPGMGGFLSPVADDSFCLIREINRLAAFSPLYLGVSRKGFLKNISDEAANERDSVSAMTTALILQNLASSSEVFIRTHNVATTRRFLQLQDQLEKKAE